MANPGVQTNAPRAEHTLILDTVNNLGLLYTDQGKLSEAETMHNRSPQIYEKALSAGNVTTYIPALNTAYNLGFVFAGQSNMDRA
ncbi:hypothetical protein K458DRAFT_395671 [Lentithecium fluviatile CBS 122367]|uniref:Tetratricopeptide repeat protein n=1 Tax=Lentithecium fluviatile CBS 122367 TaxID=1168545 RepID=A0A6G1IHR1_9PLEO|nr:hypothetical protein K458DRAFT_395671 [Lentithecium fluviatile CBS 122367]